jgi:hypothetical protein
MRLDDLNKIEVINPYSFFDSLSVVDRIGKVLGNATLLEVHLFTYLACLLALYRNEPVAEWGYSFVGTKMGAPYSREIETAVTCSVRNGFLNDSNSGFVLTERGMTEIQLLSDLSQNSLRQVYLEASCSTLLAFPVGIIREALFNEPGLKRTVMLSSTRPLLTGAPLELLYEQFSKLSQAVGVEIEDLMIPAVVWVAYLSRISLIGIENVEGDVS